MTDNRNADGQLEFVRPDGLTIFAPGEHEEAAVREFVESGDFAKFEQGGDNTDEIWTKARALRFYIYQGEPVKKTTRKRKKS
jgi:hypothetical protein